MDVARRSLFLSILGLTLLVFAWGPAVSGAVVCSAGLRGGGPSGWEPIASGQFDDAHLFDFSGLDVARTDAFDGYGQPLVNGVGYAGPGGGCTRNEAHTKLVFPKQTIGGIEVRPMVLTDRNTRIGRQFVSLKNPGGVSVTFNFTFNGDLGSDDVTNVALTSNGNSTVEGADRWATSCEDAEVDGCGNVGGDDVDRDPELAHNWEGKDAPDGGDSIELNDGDGEFDVDFLGVTIKPGKTKAFMEVVSLSTTLHAANDAAKRIDRNPDRARIFQGLSDKQRNRLRNW